VNQLALAYTSDGPGDAPALVLGNSLGTTMAVWDAQLDSLVAHFRVVRWELPGHGGSPEPSVPVTIDGLGRAVIAMLDDLGLSRVSYCGVSLGGMVGMSLAARDAHRVERLAVCSTSARLTPARAWHERAAAVRAEGMGSIATRVISRWFTPDFSAREPALVSRITASFLETNVEGYARCCEAIAAMDLRPDLPLIHCPTLVISGADDTSIPPAHGAEIAAAVSGSRLVCVEQAAHLAIIERAETITPLLLEHFVTS
jgi:3-oxoadipate enol-lactonase